MRSPAGKPGKARGEITTLIGRRCTHSNVFSRPVLIGRGLGTCSCSLWNAQGQRHVAAHAGATLLGGRAARAQVSGGHGGGETPVPIPNTAVKPASADGTWGVTPWESRTPPGVLTKARVLRQRAFVAAPDLSRAELGLSASRTACAGPTGPSRGARRCARPHRATPATRAIRGRAPRDRRSRRDPLFVAAA